MATNSPAPWRRLGAVLECRLDVRFALRRAVRAAPEEAAGVMRMPAAEVLDLFDRPVAELINIAQEISDG